MAGWNGSNRREELPANWAQLRRAARARARGQCERIIRGKRCNRRGTDLHHKHRDIHDLDHMEWLCSEHHRVETNAQAKAAQHARYVEARYRQAEAHPGAARGSLSWLK